MLKEEIDELIKEWEQITKGAGISEYLNWSRRAVKILRRVRAECVKRKDLRDWLDS